MLNVLFLTHRLPYAPNRGDRIRAFHTLRLLQRRCAVRVVSLVHDDHEAARVKDVERLARSVHIARAYGRARYATALRRLPGTQPITHVLLDSPDIGPAIARAVAECRPDVVLAYCSGMARFALDPPLADIPLVVDLVDVDSVKWAALAARSRGPLRFIYAREAKYLADFERTIAERAVATVVVNERERDAMQAVTASGTVTVVPSGVDIGYFRPPAALAADRRVVFCGVMSYEPNERGALWLARQVWPLVIAQMPDARLYLVGSEPSRRLRRAAWKEKTITVTGAVPDVRQYLWGAAAAAAPLQIARGIQNKVLEAVAAGLPAVVTPAVAGGLPAAVMPPCRVADDAPAFARELIDLLRRSDEQRRAMLPADADLRSLGWDARLAPLGDLLERAARRPEFPVARVAAS